MQFLKIKFSNMPLLNVAAFLFLIFMQNGSAWLSAEKRWESHGDEQTVIGTEKRAFLKDKSNWLAFSGLRISTHRKVHVDIALRLPSSCNGAFVTPKRSIRYTSTEYSLHLSLYDITVWLTTDYAVINETWRCDSLSDEVWNGLRPGVIEHSSQA